MVVEGVPLTDLFPPVRY